MKWPDQARLAEALLPAVLEAGRVVMMHYHGADAVAVERKADNSPVTQADRDGEAIILAALGHVAPGVPVIAEEAVAAGIRPEVGDTFFLVDPLDGTKEFISRNGEFTVNVGLIVYGRPRLGIIYAPALGDLFLTLGPEKAFEARFSVDAPPSQVDTSYLRAMRTRCPPATGLVAVESRSHKSAKLSAELGLLNIVETRNIGSSLKFCLIARGEADVYVRQGPTCEWDTAAGHAILSAAGGAVTTLDGQDFAYGKVEQKFINPGFVASGIKPLKSLT